MSLSDLKLFSREMESFIRKLNDLLLSNCEDIDSSFDKLVDKKQNELNNLLGNLKRDVHEVQQSISESKKLQDKVDEALCDIKEKVEEVVNLPNTGEISNDVEPDIPKIVVEDYDNSGQEIDFEELLNCSLPTLQNNDNNLSSTENYKDINYTILLNSSIPKLSW